MRIKNKTTKFKTIVIDKVSMVSNLMLKHIHERLKEIFSTPESVWLGGLSMVVVGDFYRSPPVEAKPTFAPYKNDLFNIAHP